MTKSRALGFAACHKQELFVAQELINKVKSKCGGIMVEYLFGINNTKTSGIFQINTLILQPVKYQ